MPELSFRNIDQISSDIRREEISFSHLLDDLIDHVCCDVEYEMQSGIDFFEAYRKVRQKMGSGRRIREIQEETLYAVDSKYRKMKNTMKFSGIAGTILFGFATLFKIQHWPGAGILMTLGAFLLAFLFMPSAMGVLWKETHSRRRIFLLISGFLTGFLFIAGALFKIQHWPVAGYLLMGSVVSAVFLFLPALLSNRLNDSEMRNKRNVYIIGTAGAIFYILGMFFKIQHWPASSVLMILGLIILGFIALPLYTWLTWKDEKNITAAFIFIIIGSLLIIVPGALINLNLQHMYDSGFYPLIRQQQQLLAAQQAANRSLLGSHNDSTDFSKMKLVDTKTSAVIDLICSIQNDMIREAEGEPGKPAVNTSSLVKTGAGYEIIYEKISRPFHPDPAAGFLLPGCVSRQELDNILNDYYNYLGTIVPSQELEKLKLLLAPSVYLPGETSEKVRLSLMSALHSLEILKSNLLTVESRVMEFIITR